MGSGEVCTGPILDKLREAGIATFSVGQFGPCEVVDTRTLCSFAKLTKRELYALALEIEAIADGLG